MLRPKNQLVREAHAAFEADHDLAAHVQNVLAHMDTDAPVESQVLRLLEIGLHTIIEYADEIEDDNG